MKNKKILAILTIAASVSMLAAGCNFGAPEPEEQVVVDVTPTPEPTVTPTPEPTIAPNVQDSTYTSSTGVSIKLPDATWANKADEADMLSFESPEQGKILILHGKGEDDMSSAMLPDTQDLAAALEQASDLVEGTDFEIQNYTSSDVEGVGVYSYTVKYTDATKSGGYAYAIHKIFKSADEYYNICGSVVDDASFDGIQKAVDSFGITGDSSLKAAAPVQTSDGTAADGASDGTATDGSSTDGTGAGTDNASTDGTSSSTDGSSTGSGSTEAAYGNSRGFTMDQLTDTNQTRTIYRNSDGHPLVITPDGNGNWVDFDGNTYRFVNNEDVYDQNDVDYYWHGEGADVYYMPVE